MNIPELTPELCETAIARYVTPMFEANIASGHFGNRDGSLIIATIPDAPIEFDSPEADFRDAVVLYEHSWGRHQNDKGDFALKSVQKLFGSWQFRKDYGRVLVENPEFVKRHGLIRFAGAVVRDVTPDDASESARLPLLVASYAGLWYWHDAMIAGHSLDGIKAEITRRASNY
ncbi:MAG: hypothetical protein JWN38_96 [Candidatus Saccharibacteria bacterium]|nr:hypothetical protein [Candidatus Saccharibacteria bacterium]